VITFAPTWIQLLSLLVSVVLPLFVGLVTTRATSAAVKATLLAALAFASGLGGELLAALNAGVSYDLATGVFSGLATFLIAVGLHYGLWKPTGATSAVQAVGRHRAE
jgi:phosphotransferase system  glucose/maltose/N-acetylglucosamine-specific IIC component